METREQLALPSEKPKAAFRILEHLIVLAKRKRLIFKWLTAGILAAIAVAVLLPKRFEGTARIMPPQQNQSTATVLLSQLGPLAALAGKELGGRNTSDLYVALLHSRTVADALIRQFSLMQVYGKRTVVDTRKRLESATEITVGKEGVISISVRDRDPERAAALANAYVEELRRLTQSIAVTEAGRRRIFFEHEVQTTSEDLAKAEFAFRQTQETTGMIQLDSQAAGMITAHMTLKAQVAAKEAQIESMGSFATPQNPDVVLAKQELSALRNQMAQFELGKTAASTVEVALTRVPEAGLEYLRRLRELKYREALHELLLKQYEIARLDEAKDAAIIQVVDKAIRPEEQVRNWRVRLSIAGIIILFAALYSTGLAFVLERIQRAKENTQHAAHLQLLKYYFSGGNKQSIGSKPDSPI